MDSLGSLGASFLEQMRQKYNHAPFAVAPATQSGVWVAEEHGVTPSQRLEEQFEVWEQAESEKQLSLAAIAERNYSTEEVLRLYLQEVCEIKYECETCRKWYVRKEKQLDSGQMSEKFVPVTCNERDLCPSCGIGYGSDKGEELYSLMEAVIMTRKQKPHNGDALLWSIVLTVPSEISAAIGEMVDRDFNISKTLTKLQSNAKKWLAEILFKTHEKELMGTACWHPFKSKNPLGGWHWHVHLMIPNLTPDGRYLSRRGEIPEHRFNDFKLKWWGLLKKLFPNEMHLWMSKWNREDYTDHISEKLNFETKFLKEGRKFKRELKHLCMYDARHPFLDLRQWTIFAEIYGWNLFNRPDDVKRFVNRAAKVQSLKTRRYFGALVPGQRKRLNISKEEKGVSEWEKDPNSWYKLTHFSDTGHLTFNRYVVGFDGCIEQVNASLINTRLYASLAPVRWQYGGASP